MLERVNYLAQDLLPRICTLAAQRSEERGGVSGQGTVGLVQGLLAKMMPGTLGVGQEGVQGDIRDLGSCGCSKMGERERG